MKHKLYMDIARRVAQESHAERNKVGAVMVKDGNITVSYTHLTLPTIYSV